MRRVTILCAAVVGCAVLPVASRAAVTWSTITAESDIANTGTLVVGANTGNNGDVTTTVNGVNFSAIAAPSGWVDNTFDWSTGFSSGSPLDQLLSHVINPIGTSNQSLTFSGLTVGHTYRLQIIQSHDPDTTTRKWNFTVDGNAQLDSFVNQFTQSGPVDITSQWVADSTTVTANFLPADNTQVAHMAGFALHDISAVPEPAALWLLAPLVLKRRRATRS